MKILTFGTAAHSIDVTSVDGDVISFFGDGEDGEGASVLAALPPTDFGEVFNFESGFLQFDRSQGSTFIAGTTASLAGGSMGGGTGSNPVVVPEPATTLLFITAMCRLLGGSKQPLS